MVNERANGTFESTDQLDDAAAETFFEAVDAIAGGSLVCGETAEAVEIVTFEAVSGGVF